MVTFKQLNLNIAEAILTGYTFRQIANCLKEELHCDYQTAKREVEHVAADLVVKAIDQRVKKEQALLK
jgi:hypothetical protein